MKEVISDDAVGRVAEESSDEGDAEGGKADDLEGEEEDGGKESKDKPS